MKPVLTSRTNLFIITAFIVFAFSGCSSDSIYILTEEELTWMAYDNNDVLNFQSNNGGSLTYSVVHKSRGNGNAGVIITSADSLNLASSSIDLYKDGSGFTVTVGWPHYPIKFTPTSMIAKHDTVAGTVFTDVYISTTAATDSINIIKEVHYSKANGVIKFIDKTGGIWSLKN